MEKTMKEVTVLTRDSKIFIEQSYGFGETDTICLLPEQIGLLISWLKDAETSLCEKAN